MLIGPEATYNLPDTPVDLTNTSKYFRMLSDPPGAW